MPKTIIYRAVITFHTGKIEAFSKSKRRAEDALYFLKIFVKHELGLPITKMEVKEDEIQTL